MSKGKLFLIGLGLGDEKDITLKGLEAIKECDYLYLEAYTSILAVKPERLVLFNTIVFCLHPHRNNCIIKRSLLQIENW